MARRYHTVTNRGAFSEKQLADLLIHNGQQLLPMIKLVEQSRIAVEELIDCVGRVTIQAVLMASAEQVAGPRQRGTAQDREILWYGKQGGSVYLREGKLAVERPRLRRRGRGHGKEVVVPATRPCRTERVLRALVDGQNATDYLFSRKWHIRKAWTAICTAAGVTDAHLHDMRRTSARDKRAVGVPTSIIMEIQGWRTEPLVRRYDIVALSDTSPFL